MTKCKKVQHALGEDPFADMESVEWLGFGAEPEETAAPVTQKEAEGEAQESTGAKEQGRGEAEAQGERETEEQGRLTLDEIVAEARLFMQGKAFQDGAYNPYLSPTQKGEEQGSRGTREKFAERAQAAETAGGDLEWLFEERDAPQEAAGVSPDSQPPGTGELLAPDDILAQLDSWVSPEKDKE